MPNTISPATIQRRLRCIPHTFSTNLETLLLGVHLRDLVNGIFVSCKLRRANTPQWNLEFQARLETQRRIVCLGIIVQELLSTNVVSVPLHENGLADQGSEMVTTQVQSSLDTVVRNARRPLLDFMLVSREWYSVGIHHLHAYPIIYSNRHACVLLQSLKKSLNDLRSPSESLL